MSVGSINFTQTNSSATIQYLRGTSNSNLVLNGNFSIEFFIKCTTSPSAQDLKSLILSQHSTWSTSNANSYWIYVDDDTAGLRPISILLSGASSILTGTIPVNDNAWNHIAIVRNGMAANNLSLFVNGVLDVRVTNTTPWDFSGTTGFCIASNPLYEPVRIAYQGSLSNLRIVNNVSSSIVTDNLNTFTNISFVGSQYQSGLALAFGATLVGWTKAGSGAIHVVDIANLFGSTTNPRNCVIMFYQDNVITQNTAVTNSNISGTPYTVTFKSGPAVYQETYQATTVNDGVVVDIIRTNDTLLQSYTYKPGVWAGFPTLTSTSFNYTGDGTGNIRIRVKSLLNTTDRFGGCVDDIMITTNSTPIYTSNFTVPNTNLTAISGTALLLNTALNSPFLDSSPNNITITSFNAPTASNVGPFPDPTPGTIVCFLENSKILTDKGYQPIQHLKKGDLVHTLNNGLLPINMIGKKAIHHPASSVRLKDQLYKCSSNSNEFPEVFEDLIITGCHSILVDDFRDLEQRDKTIDVLGKIYVTDGKYRLPACIDERTSVYETKGIYTIYHLALENDDYYSNYGIYANGLLVETCSKRFLKELANMELVE
jgi:hypothetical protein